TTAPSFTISPLIRFGCPAATTKISAEMVCAVKSLVYLWQMVVVAFPRAFFGKHNRSRATYDITGAHNYGMLPFCRNTIIFEKLKNAGRRTRMEAGLANRHPSYIHGMKTIHIFVIVNRLNNIMRG